jgi:galactose-1-phosphate uridylyltransferase
MGEQFLGQKQIETLTQINKVDRVTYSDLVDLFRRKLGNQGNLPDIETQIDPRNGERILYNTARSRRPHDKSEGFTSINKNLFPIVFPFENGESDDVVFKDQGYLSPEGLAAKGLHFLQWSSSYHDHDWHNMSREDRIVVMDRLAALERILLTTSQGVMPSLVQFGDDLGRNGFVSIIKNSGSPVGGSIEHGHQQIAFSNIMPRRIREDLRFEKDRGILFSEFMLQENPADLLVRDYEQAVLMVPYFMRRPFDMLLILKDTEKRYLHELSRKDKASLVQGWHDAIRLIHHIMPMINRAIAYNVITHNGPGAGLYFEFLPHSQEEGGFEKLGLSVCQSNPDAAANILRERMDSQS